MGKYRREEKISMKEHILGLLLERDKRYEQRFQERDLRYDQRFRETEEAKRVLVQTTEKRFDGVNEFRAAMSDQQKNYITRSEALALVVAVSTVTGAIVGALSYFAKH